MHIHIHTQVLLVAEERERKLVAAEEAMLRRRKDMEREHAARMAEAEAAVRRLQVCTRKPVWVCGCVGVCMPVCLHAQACVCECVDVWVCACLFVCKRGPVCVCVCTRGLVCGCGCVGVDVGVGVVVGVVVEPWRANTC